MKSIIPVLFFVMATQATLAKPFLSPVESDQIKGYMNEICGDTYCGGDIEYFPLDLDCDESQCVIEFYGKTYFEVQSQYYQLGEMMSLVGQTKTYAKLESQITFISFELDDESKGELSFSCALTNLSQKEMSYTEKEDYMYDKILDSCITPYEVIFYKNQK